MLAVGTESTSLTNIPLDPSKMEWGLMDVSADDAGRVMDAESTMYKQRITQKRKIALAWSNPDAEVTSTILKAFNPEYVWVRYWDAMDGQFEVRRFYVGDRSAPLRQFQTLNGTRYSELSFDIIER